MKLFIKILLVVFVTLVANVKVVSATITFSNIQETTTSFSFQHETTKTIYRVIENDEANCCQNGQDLVGYRNLAISSKAVVAKGGMTDLQLVTRAAQKAETAIGGTGGVAGTFFSPQFLCLKSGN